jgi:hypothetical protein
MDIGVPVSGFGRVAVEDAKYTGHPTVTQFDNHVVLEHGAGRFTITGIHGTAQARAARWPASRSERTAEREPSGFHPLTSQAGGEIDEPAGRATRSERDEPAGNRPRRMSAT